MRPHDLDATAAAGDATNVAEESMKPFSIALLVGLASTAACGDDVLSYSAPVGIKLSVASGDVSGGQLVDEKNINTESGNPYGASIAEARAQLGGGDPGALRLDRLQLQLEPTSTNVTVLGEVFAGQAEIQFLMNGSGALLPVATLAVTAATAAGPIDSVVGFDASGVTAADWTGLVGGQFKVVLRGPAGSRRRTPTPT